MRKLEKTTNFLSLYLHHAGQSNCPRLFHLWSGLSLIAACVGQNVWITRYKHAKLYPNLYIILLGPAGLGKGLALGCATKFLYGNPNENIVGFYSGKLTAAAMISYMHSHRNFRTQYVHGTRLYYISEELSYAVGTGPMADDWVRQMTALYEGKLDPFIESTRKYGIHRLKDVCINWIAGSTKAWLVNSISPDAIEGGFFARTIIPSAEHDFNERITVPTYPDDYDEVVNYLAWRVHYLCRIRGEFTLTPEALEVENDWVQRRPAPTDPGLFAIWQREQSMVLKLSMLLSLADKVFWEKEQELVITSKHIADAQTLLDDVRRNIKEIAALGHQSRETIQQSSVREIIKDSKRIQHSVLLRRVEHKAINTKLLSLIIDNMVATDEVERVWEGDGKSRKCIYQWRKIIIE